MLIMEAFESQTWRFRDGSGSSNLVCLGGYGVCGYAPLSTSRCSPGCEAKDEYIEVEMTAFDDLDLDEGQPRS